MRASLLLWALACVLVACALHVNADDSKCDSLAMTMTEIDSGLYNIWWYGDDKETLLALTVGHKIWRSTNGGSRWDDQSDVIPDFTDYDTWPYNSAKGGASYLHYAADPDYVVLEGYGKRYWTSTNAGQTWMKYDADFLINTIIPHPEDPHVFLVSSNADSCFDSKNKEPCVKSIYVTIDFGSTFTLVSSYVDLYMWGDSTDQTDINDINDLNILYTSWPGATGEQYSLDYDNTVLMRPTNIAKGTVKVLQTNVTGLMYKDDIVWVATRNFYGNGESNLLYMSKNDGDDFTLTSFPKRMKESSYKVFDSSEDFAMVAINHGKGNGDVGNLYTSGSKFANFDLSLENVKRNRWGGVDVVKFYDINGIYIANYFPEDVWTGNDDSSSDSPHLARTAITYDKGGEWTFMDPPAGVSCEADQGQGHVYVQHCFLNLFGMTDSSYGRTYTAPNAVGLAMSTGNVGPYLFSRGDEEDTYLTRDAGWNWYKVANGSHTYEYGDHGALIVMVYTAQQTDSFSYTWNQGLDWHSCVVADEKFDFYNLVVDPEYKSQKFVGYGYTSTSGVLVSIDFTGLHERACTGSDAPDTDASDYELFFPHDESDGETCVLGVKESFVRRKRDRECYNGMDYETEQTVDTCSCTQEDYECDEGWERKVNSAECVVENDDATDPAAIPDPCDSTYMKRTGYRLVPSSQCDPKTGLDLRAKRVMCPGVTSLPPSEMPSDSTAVDTSDHGYGTGGTNPGTTGGTGDNNTDDGSERGPFLAFLFIGLLACVVVALVGAVYFYKSNDEFREKVQGVIPFLGGGGDGAGDDVTYQLVGNGGPDCAMDDDEYLDDARVLDDDDIAKYSDDFNDEPSEPSGFSPFVNDDDGGLDL